MSSKWSSFPKFPSFHKVPQDDDCENLIPGSPGYEEKMQQTTTSRSGLSKFYTTVLVITSSLLTLFTGLQMGSRRADTLTNKDIILKTSKWSPMMDDIEIKYEWVQFDGRFMNETIFRQDGSDEVDAAWESLGVNYKALVVPDHLAEKTGLAPGQVQVAPQYGGGYPGNVEAMHHLHCLNVLRQSLWYNYDHYRAKGEHAFKNDGEVFKKHVSHCLDTLRQQLMCMPSIDILGQVWYHGAANQNIAIPDFNTKHICRNYDDIRQWAEDHQATMPPHMPKDYLVEPKEEDILPSIP